MKKKPEIIIMCGNIGTGKTNLVKEYAEKGYVVIARDDLRYDIGGGIYIFNRDLEPAIWQTEIDMLYNFMKLGVNIIVDEVGISKQMRERYLKMINANFPNYKKICIEMPKLSMKVAVNRRMKDPHGCPNRTLWTGVWQYFDKLYEKPTKKEGWDKIIRRRG